MTRMWELDWSHYSWYMHMCDLIARVEGRVGRRLDFSSAIIYKFTWLADGGYIFHLLVAGGYWDCNLCCYKLHTYRWSLNTPERIDIIDASKPHFSVPLSQTIPTVATPSKVWGGRVGSGDKRLVGCQFSINEINTRLRMDGEVVGCLYCFSFKITNTAVVSER